MGKRGPKPRRAADPEWTPELAYAVGLLATDGCLSPDGRHIDFTSQDTELIETLKSCLGIQTRMSWKRGGFTGKLAPHIQFGDVGLYRWLLAIGLTPRKSLTLGPIRVPDLYFFDALRGEFDGDGSSYAYWDTRWHSSVSLYIQFCSGSQRHLLWIKENVRRLVGIDAPLAHGRSIYVLRYAKSAARPLYHAMYYQPGLPHLVRKKEKLDRQWQALERSRLGERPVASLKGVAICIT